MSLKRPGCAGYRDEMMLLGLLKRLHETDVTEEEKRLIQEKVTTLQCDMGLETFTDDP